MKKRIGSLTWVGFTLILLGYLMVWLPNPAAGFALTGIELGEWVKFLPAVQAGDIGPRELFYLPPITLGLMMALVTSAWSNRRWQTWAMRGLAFVVSWLAFTAIETIRFEGTAQWGLRMTWIGMVALAGVVAARLRQRRSPTWIPRTLIVFGAVVGTLLPATVFFPIRDLVSGILGMPLGVGVGFWFNVLGHILAAIGVVWGWPAAQDA